MQIKKLKLTNAFQHGSMEIGFQPFQAIVGANGSGKSNIIESIGLALTGILTLPGKLESAIKEGQEKGKVEMTLESEGELVELVTHLGKSNRSLVRGPLKITKASEVMEYLERQVLRTPFNIVNTSSIIRQGQLDAGLFDTQAKRTDAFLRMAGLSDIEKKRQALADAKAQVTVPMLSFTVTETEKKVQEIKDYLAKVWSEHAAIPITDKVKLDACKTFIATWEKVEKAKTDLATVEKALLDVQQLAREAKSLVDEKQAARQQFKKQEELIRPQVDQAKIRIANFERAKKDWDKKTKLQLLLTEQHDQLGSLVAPGEYTGNDPDEMVSLVAELQTKIEAAKETIKAFAKPTAECPTCRRACTIQEAEHIGALAKAELRELEQVSYEAAASLRASKEAKAHWETACSKYAGDCSNIKMAISMTQTALADLKDVAQPTVNAEDQKTITYYSQLLVSVGTADQEEREAADLLNTTVVRMAGLEARVSELRAQTQLQDGLIGVPLPEAKAYVADHEQRLAKMNELNGLIHGTEKQLKDEQARLEKLAEETEKAKTLMQYCDYLEFARTALHRDNFPSGKVKAFVDRMLINANMYLDAMQSGFSVSYHKDDGFIAFFPQDNKHMRADRLSGGEKVTFALAFRFAVNDLHTDTGFLILDEPTVWLDDKHIDYVINALALVKTKIVPRVQLIIVTHDEKLAAVADSVFEVAKR